MPEGNGSNQRTKLNPLGMARRVCERGPQLQRVLVGTAWIGEVIGAEDEGKRELFGGSQDTPPPVPVEAVLPLDHQANLNHRSLPHRLVFLVFSIATRFPAVDEKVEVTGGRFRLPELDVIRR